MSGHVYFTCACVNDRLVGLYSVKDEESLWRIRPSVLAGYTWAGFFKEIKNRLLSKSIHKGKFLGFDIGGTIVNKFDLSNPSLMQVGDIKLVIENMRVTDEDLSNILKVKMTALKSLSGFASFAGTCEFSMRCARELCYTSDKIEGSTIEADEAKANLKHFRDELPADQCDSDHVEMRNHMLAIVDIVFPMKDKPLTSIDKAYILSLHRALDVSHMKPEDKGAYRRVEVTIARGPNPGFTRAADVPRAIDDMLLELHSKSDSTDTLHLAAWLHFTFVQIHPFADGNGRVGRLLMNTLLLQRGYPLTSIHHNVREIYYKSLQVARRIETGALPLPAGARTPYDFLQRILTEFTVRSLDIGMQMLSDHGHRAGSSV